MLTPWPQTPIVWNVRQSIPVAQAIKCVAFYSSSFGKLIQGMKGHLHLPFCIPHSSGKRSYSFVFLSPSLSLFHCSQYLLHTWGSSHAASRGCRTVTKSQVMSKEQPRGLSLGQGPSTTMTKVKEKSDVTDLGICFEFSLCPWCNHMDTQLLMAYVESEIIWGKKVSDYAAERIRMSHFWRGNKFKHLSTLQYLLTVVLHPSNTSLLFHSYCCPFCQQNLSDGGWKSWGRKTKPFCGLEKAHFHESSFCILYCFLNEKKEFIKERT